ncbi:MAG: 30S ribosomal protein S8 [Chloroflexi bacterium]|nr:30S ribosomal protein S8 [Chloroflexota bacterium]
MSINDPIADMITRIRNATMSRHESVEIPNSKIKKSILKILKKEGFISDLSSKGDSVSKEVLSVKLKYFDGNTPAIMGLKRVSKPGLRVYVGKNEIPRYFGGIATAMLSTSKGILTGHEAKIQGLGGELLFYVW